MNSPTLILEELSNLATIRKDKPFTMHELEKIIQQIPIRITPGLDNISASLIKNIFTNFPFL